MKRRLSLNIISVSLLFCTALFGCTTASTVQVQQPFESGAQRKICIEPCANRADYHGEHDLASEATRALTDKLKKSGLFEIVPNAQLVMTCDVEHFQKEVLRNGGLCQGGVQRRRKLWLWSGRNPVIK